MVEREPVREGDPQRVITPELIGQLRERHVRMYERRLAGGHPAVVVSETTALLELWRGMAGKSWLLLSEAEESEVVDALSDIGWEFGFDIEGEVVVACAPANATGG